MVTRPDQMGERMSHDVDLYADLGGPELSFVEEVGNYTSNVSGMWQRALGRSLSAFNGTQIGRAHV